MKHLLITLSFLCSLSSLAQVSFEFSNIEPLPNAINSKFDESCPLFDPVSQRLYFTRTLHPENRGGKDLGQDLWYADLQGTAWGTPSNDLKQLNNYLNNSAIGLSQDANRLYLVGTYIKKINLQTGFSISIKDPLTGEWPRPQPLEMPSLNIKAPLFYGGFVNPSEDLLIISMNSKNSLGEEDLYVSIKTTKGWSDPIWLGDSINTSGYEISPFLFDDGKTLLFASTGHGGYGDCDIFYAYRKDSTWTNWTKPVNAGQGINSPGFDAFPYAVGPTLYFSSNRQDTFSNIYVAQNNRYYLDADTMRIAFESYGNRMKDIRVEVLDEEGTSLGNHTSDDEGLIRIDGLKEKKQYTLIPKHEEINLTYTTPYLLNKKGDYVQILQFALDGSVKLNPVSPEQLNQSKLLEKPDYIAGMHGVFEVDRVPVKNIALALTDSTGKVYQYAMTDKNGRFQFAETADSLKLNIKVITELEYVRRNGVVYYTDPSGRKLFKSIVTEKGTFKYQKIEAQELGRLKALASTDAPMRSAKLENTGIFKYDNLPKEGVTLYLYDENDNLVETVVTDADGRFQFSKLKADQNFKIKPADEKMQEGSLVFTDSRGNTMSVLEATDFGFKYKALDADIMRGLALMVEEDSDVSLAQNFVFSIGLFKYKNLPKEGITLRLLDENDNIIETVTTDANGHFVFSMLNPDKNYKVQVVGIEDESLIQSQLYFVDKEGNVMTGLLEKDKYTFDQLQADYFFTISQVNNGETELIITESFKDVIGQFKYQNLGRAGVLLELLDENNKVIETALTDENGNFRFKQLAKESNYFVRLAEKDAGLLDASSLLMMDENNRPLEQETELTDAGFAFKTLPRSEESIAGMQLGDRAMDFNKFMSAEASSKAKSDKLNKQEATDPMGGMEALTGAKNDLKLKTLYFNFNSVRLSNYDRYHLNHGVYKQVKKSGQPILIVGYTCDLGTNDVNKEIALARAKEAKDYLISLGLDADRIEIEGIAPAEDSNMTYGERVESRRIDVFHLTP
jgi:outer membrane protein OmpA-like peptidoglycan-associated protein